MSNTENLIAAKLLADKQEAARGVRLKYAAPDLLGALYQIAFLDRDGQLAQIAKAAIAKAEGGAARL